MTPDAAHALSEAGGLTLVVALLGILLTSRSRWPWLALFVCGAAMIVLSGIT